ncbi:MAG TPA: PEP-CTERM sorting domain-containing protein [Candidatus Acidoferrum sp.]|nr:PEP-CTERM sorting domain-containing protein [Candidatus Acidoferrum sp.]
MKKLIVAAFAVTAALGVLAQGTVTFVGNSPVGTAHVWGPSSSALGLSIIGNASNDNPAGTNNYSGYGMTMIGGTGLTGKYGASTTFAQLLAANGAGQSETSLLPSGGTTTFRSSSSGGAPAGIIVSLNDTLGNVPADSPAATLEVVAWDNSSGAYPTWASASTAWNEGLIAGGKSGAFTVNNIGGTVNNPANFTFSSFNLYFQQVPEPTTFALAGLGAAALLIFRRRK